MRSSGLSSNDKVDWRELAAKLQGVSASGDSFIVGTVAHCCFSNPNPRDGLPERIKLQPPKHRSVGLPTVRPPT